MPERIPVSFPPGVVVFPHMSTTMAGLRGAVLCLPQAFPCGCRQPRLNIVLGSWAAFCGWDGLPGCCSRSLDTPPRHLTLGGVPCLWHTHLQALSPRSHPLLPSYPESVVSGRLKTCPNHTVKSLLKICPVPGLSRDHQWSPEPLSQFEI